MKLMKRRAAETLMEVLTAMTVFGIIMMGFSDFMAEQTTALARTKNMDKVMYYAQKWISSGDYTNTDSAEGGNVTFALEDNFLVVTRGDTVMNFHLK